MLSDILFFDITIFSFIILLTLLIISFIQRSKYSLGSTLFKAMIITIMIAHIMEPLGWLTDGESGRFNYFLGYLSNSAIILLGPILIGFWASYLDYIMHRSKKRIIQRKFYLYPALAIFITLVFNRFIPIYFEIEPVTNHYSQGAFFNWQYLIHYGFVVYIFYMVIRDRDKNKNRALFGMTLFMIFPVIASLIQLIESSILITWPSLSVAVIVVYLFFETTTGAVDMLTKVNSRALLESYLHSLIEDKKDFVAIMFDLDHFKNVNDLYGHHMGDRVLIDFAQTLTDYMIEKRSVVARLAGDEFFVIYQNYTRLTPEHYIDLIHEELIKNPAFNQFEFLGFSAGFIINDHKMTMDDILNMADKKMYEQKKHIHSHDESHHES